jgi:putative ABC transport system permease protein
MKKSKINQSKLLFLGSLRMTVQLVLAGLVLSYIFYNPHPLFTVVYIFLMVLFSIHRVLSKNPTTNSKFKLAVAVSISFSGLFVVVFFIIIVVGTSVFNPQYAIPISGMIFGNAMTGILIGLKAFNDSLEAGKPQIDTLLNLGVPPKKILLPFVNNALETALLPTMNSMLGMGIVSLPGMMTGQILAGTMPLTAIMYQIAVVIAICTAVCLTVFFSLNLGYKTLYNDRNQMLHSK